MSRKQKSVAENVSDAAEAHSDLSIFSAVIALMESSLVSSNAFSAEERIVTICKAETAKALARYDAAVAKVARPQPTKRDAT